MLRLWERVERLGLSVRETEALARRAISREILPRRRGRDPELKSLEQELSRKFATKAVIDGSKRRGRLALEYYSEDDLQRLLDLLLS
jgi:ParB family chromosome partitioning protein